MSRRLAAGLLAALLISWFPPVYGAPPGHTAPTRDGTPNGYSAPPGYGGLAEPPLFLAPVGLHDEGEGVRNLQKLLSALGFFDGPATGVFDERTRRAVAAFQRRYGHPVTGEADAATLETFGPDTAPAFLYTVQPGDTLSGIAARFRSPVPWILRFNPRITSAHRIRYGDTIAVPVDFPLPGGAVPQRMSAQPGRFLGSYKLDVPFAQAGDLMARYAAVLEEHGFETTMNPANPVDGITLRNRGVVLGRVTFSAADSGDASQMDVGLLFQREGEGGGLSRSPSRGGQLVTEAPHRLDQAGVFRILLHFPP